MILTSEAVVQTFPDICMYCKQVGLSNDMRRKYNSSLYTWEYTLIRALTIGMRPKIIKELQLAIPSGIVDQILHAHMISIALIIAGE